MRNHLLISTINLVINMEISMKPYSLIKSISYRETFDDDTQATFEFRIKYQIILNVDRFT